MYISDAIRKAKEKGYWNIVPNNPSTGKVNFYKGDGKGLKDIDSTELDVYSGDPEKELEDLWLSLCREFDSCFGYVVSVEAYGCIV